MEMKQKFATFFGTASKGRKIASILCWIATALLIAALFIPGYKLNFGDNRPDTKVTEAKQQLLEEWAPQKKSTKSFVENGSTSFFSYNANSELYHSESFKNPAVAKSSIVGILLLVLSIALLLAAIVFSLYTMNILSLAANSGVIAEILCVYFFVFAKHFKSYAITGVNITVKPALSVLLIALLAAAAILQIAAIIVHYVVTDDAADDFVYDDYTQNDRNAETGLLDDSQTAASGSQIASLVQLNTSKTFPLYNNSELVIGKGSQANIIVENPIISRTHAKIGCYQGVCTIQDLDSKNGTFVGDRKITGGAPVPLNDGDYITLGNELFQFKK